jgi:hypothetical protein
MAVPHDIRVRLATKTEVLRVLEADHKSDERVGEIRTEVVRASQIRSDGFIENLDEGDPEVIYFKPRRPFD